jgi:hypothetical protein
MDPRFPEGQIYSLTDVVVLFNNFHKGEIAEPEHSQCYDALCYENTQHFTSDFTFLWLCGITLCLVVCILVIGVQEFQIKIMLPSSVHMTAHPTKLLVPTYHKIMQNHN